MLLERGGLHTSLLPSLPGPSGSPVRHPGLMQVEIRLQASGDLLLCTDHVHILGPSASAKHPVAPSSRPPSLSVFPPGSGLTILQSPECHCELFTFTAVPTLSVPELCRVSLLSVTGLSFSSFSTSTPLVQTLVISVDCCNNLGTEFQECCHLPQTCPLQSY